MKYCKKCGAQLEENAKFCGKCGCQVQKEADRRTYKNFGSEPVFELEDDSEKKHDKKPKTSLRLAVVCLSVFVVAIILLAFVMITFNSHREESLRAFKEEISNYEEAITEKHLNVPGNSYYELLQEAKTALEGKDYSDFDDLTEKMRDAKAHAKNTDEEEAQLAELATNCESLKNYDLTSGDYERRTNQLINKVSEAVEAKDIEAIGDLKSEYETLVADLDKDNLSRITSLKEKISQIDIEDMTNSEQVAVSNYEEEVNQLVDDGQYARAIDKMESWHEYMETLKMEKAAAKNESMREEQLAGNLGGGYILPTSSSQYLTETDLEGLSSYELRIARNEIYARHGRTFQDSELQAYFDSQPWYQPNPDFDDSQLSDCERENVNFIKEHE